MKYQLGEYLNISKLREIIEDKNAQVELSYKAIENIVKCRQYLDDVVAQNKKVIYGVNTGFGSFCNVIIDQENLSQLQTNLILSHACGVGEEVPIEVVRLMILLKIQSFSYGNSGISVAVVERLIAFFNSNVTPVVYQQGSLGASGDLAPLAHLSLPLLGLGEVYLSGEKIAGAHGLEALNLSPLALSSKEGLALLNGTQFMLAYAVWCMIKCEKLSEIADLNTAISLEAWNGRTEPFHESLHRIRPHKGQIDTAKRILSLIKDSKIATAPKTQVQDPYCFRCAPQVHGASKDTFAFAKQVFEIEINSVSDNPNIFPDEDLTISGGNFHGQPLALPLDFIAIALSELGNISERRTYKLISGKNELPVYLVAPAHSGLNSGFMIPQYTAASIVSQNKQLCSPASVDSITSSNGQEDHVSMGANAATKAYRVVENLERILAIEFFTAMQALEMRKNMANLKSSSYIESLLELYRKTVPFLTTDRVLHLDIQATISFIKNEITL